MLAVITSSHDIVRIAAEATISPQTVRRYLKGETVYDTTRDRIRKALAKLGFQDPQATPNVACRHTARGGDSA